MRRFEQIGARNKSQDGWKRVPMQRSVTNGFTSTFTQINGMVVISTSISDARRNGVNVLETMTVEEKSQIKSVSMSAQRSLINENDLVIGKLIPSSVLANEVQSCHSLTASLDLHCSNRSLAELLVLWKMQFWIC
jgi:hypothetical protein